MFIERYLICFGLWVISSTALPLFVARSYHGPHKGHSSSRCRLVCLLLIILFFSVVNIQAQDDDNPKRGFYPGGSYAIGEIETINRADGNLLLNIPLASLPAGRGGLKATLNLNYNNKLWDVTSYPVYNEHPDYDQLLYTEHVLQRGQTGGWSYGFEYSWTDLESLADPCGAHGYLHRIQVTYPDGSQHEFRPYGYRDQNGYFQVGPDGWKWNYNQSVCQSEGYVNITLATASTMTYYSTDGTYSRLEIAHDGDPGETNSANNPWTLYLPDGERVVGTPDSSGNLTSERIYDRNNNYIDIVNTASGPPRTTISDQVGRSITIDYAVLIGPNNLSWTDYITMQGFNNQTLRWSVHFKYIRVNKSYYNCTGSHCPTNDFGYLDEAIGEVDQITLPSQIGSLSYNFGYNAPDYDPANLPPGFGWGELSSVTIPSGASATYHYTYDGVDGIQWYNALHNDFPTRKDLTYQLEYDGSSTSTTETWLYSFKPNGQYYSQITGPDGGIQRDYWYSSTPRWRKNLVYKTEHPDGSVTERLWLDNTPAGTGSYNSSGVLQNMNPFVKTEFMSIKDALGNLTKTAIKDYNYDKNGNVTSISDYDWVSYVDVPRDGTGMPTGIPGTAVLKRVVTNTYFNGTPTASDITTDSANAYSKPGSPNVHDAIASSEIGDGTAIKARSEFSYDNAGTTANLTAKKSWDSSKGAYSNPLTTANSISVSTQYNPYGDPTLVTDARGFQTQLYYGPIGAFSDLYPTQVKTAYQTSVQRTETRGYDFYTGVVTLMTDVDNNVSTSTDYDAFGRPILVRAAKDKPNETRTATEYSDIYRRVIVKRDLSTVADAKLVTIQHYDQLGRIRLARQLEDVSTQSPTDETTGIKVQTRYLVSGSNSYRLVSNPFRAATSSGASSESAMGWTRSKFDNGGRVLEVQTFAGSDLPSPWGLNSTGTGTVTTSYDANFTTVTDQALKPRRSMTDGLGRPARMDEPNSSNDLGTTSSPTQPTSYTYNALGDLIKVVQGSQTRDFTYDSLSRLTSAQNPETGTVTYDYDNNGNLWHRTDARGITATLAYDALNRPTSKTYNDSPQTPTINYFYDAQTLPGGAPSFSRGYSIGRLVAVTYSGGSAGTYRGYDELGRVIRQYQQTDSVNYLVEATYFANSSLNVVTYPSVPGASDRRTITYTNDTAGRLASLSSSATTYAPAASVSGIAYAPHNGLTTETYGNSLVHAINYNSRLQPIEIKLGTSGSPTSIVDLVYSYGTTNNNGNVQSITYSGGGLSYSQSFGYDSLNRLTTSQENSGSSWSQTNGYDQYGNRWIDYGGGVQNLSFSTSNNRITTSGYSYDSAGNLTNDTFHVFTFDAENRIRTVNAASAYVYDGEGQRVRKLVGENLRFIYGIGGEEIAEFDGGTGALKKEYIYGASELVATIEPTAVNSNGTRYTTSDTLGSPRVITNSSAAVVSRHDYMPYGEELGSGVGGRTSGLGFGVVDAVRQKFTQYERDGETGLDFAHTRYYSSGQGRFSSPDKPFAGQYRGNPQSWNMYTYVLNAPLNFVDPFGLSHWELGRDGQMHFVGDKDKEYNKDLNATWNAKNGSWDFLPNGAKPAQTIHLEVLFLRPLFSLSHLHGLGGHVAWNINGTVHSWESGGWKTSSMDEYKRENSYREMVGFVLGDENDPEWAEKFADKVLSFQGDGEGILQKLLGSGPYALRQDNCGESFCRAVNATPGLPHDGAIAPLQHEWYVVQNMRPYIRAVHRYHPYVHHRRQIHGDKWYRP